MKMSKDMIKNNNYYRKINSNTYSSSSSPSSQLFDISLNNETLIYKTYIFYTRYFVTASYFCFEKIY